VQDCWNDTYRGAPADGSSWNSGDCRQRVLRGGSFGSKPNAIRSSSRFKYDKDVRYYANGFRVVREIR
jgi:formylglycine-generating enzyme required for sulfatase activity